MKVYIVVTYADGENYNDYMPTIDGVFVNKEDAMNQYVESCKQFAPEEGEEYEDIEGNGYYEITNFYSDYHATVRIIEEEVVGIN